MPVDAISAEHATVIGPRNRAASVLVRKKLWHFITQADEDGPQHFHGTFYREDRKLDKQVRSSRISLSEEREIELSYKENFPPIRSAQKACWWKLDRRL